MTFSFSCPVRSHENTFLLTCVKLPHINSFSYQVLETDKGPLTSYKRKDCLSLFQEEFLESVYCVTVGHITLRILFLDSVYSVSYWFYLPGALPPPTPEQFYENVVNFILA